MNQEFNNINLINGWELIVKMDRDVRIKELEELVADLREYIVKLEEKVDTLIYKLNIK